MNNIFTLVRSNVTAREAAERYGLGVSGGSDYHGVRKPHIRMGSGISSNLHIPYAVLTALKALK